MPQDIPGSLSRHPHHTRLYSGSRLQNIGEIGFEIGHIFVRTAGRAKNVACMSKSIKMCSFYSPILQVSFGLLLSSCIMTYHGIHRAHKEYRAECLSTAFDLLVEFDWHGSLSEHATTTHFFAIVAIMGFSCIEPKDFPDYYSIMNKKMDYCGEAAMPIMLATCKYVAAALSDLPEAGLGREKKVEAIRIVQCIYLHILQKVNLVCAARLNPVVLKELLEEREQAQEEKDLEKYSYSPIG